MISSIITWYEYPGSYIIHGFHHSYLVDCLSLLNLLSTMFLLECALLFSPLLLLSFIYEVRLRWHRWLDYIFH